MSDAPKFRCLSSELAGFRCKRRLSQGENKKFKLTGTLQKLSPSMLKGWQNRYFVLTEKKLKYFATEENWKNKDCPKGVIRFDTVHVTLTTNF